MTCSRRFRPVGALLVAPLLLLLLWLAPVAGAANTIVVQPDGGVVTAVYAYPGFGALIRHLPDGSLDPSFGEGGVAIERRLDPFGALARQADGRLLAAASRSGGTGPRPLFGRYLPNGVPDSAYGADGLALSPIEPPLGVQPSALVPRADGSVALASSHCCYKYFPPAYANVEAFSPAGSFAGELSRLVWPTYPSYAGYSLRDLQPLADGSLVGVGSGPEAQEDGSVVSRSLLVHFVAGAPGGYDHELGGGAGLVTGPGRVATAVAPSVDGFLVVGASDYPQVLGAAGIVLRYDSAGVLDPGFGAGGRFDLALPEFSSLQLTDVVATPEGGALAVGTAYVGADPTRGHENCDDCARALVVKLDPSGALDPSFGQGGIVRLGGTASLPTLTGESIAALPDGRVLLAGTAGGLDRSAALLRLLPDGTLDPAFGSGGAAVTTPCPGSRRQRIRSGCLPKLKLSLRLKHAGSRRPALILDVRPRESWGRLQSVQLVLPRPFLVHPVRAKREDGLRWRTPGRPERASTEPVLHRRSVNFTGLSDARAVQLRLSRGAFSAPRRPGRLARLPFQVKVKLYAGWVGESRVATLRRP